MDMRKQAFALLALGFLMASCSHGPKGPGLHFRQTTVLGTEYDPTTKATRVSISFEVWDDQTQLKKLSRESFTVYEDGHPATSESLNQADTQEKRVPVVLLLDTSLSMYQANSVLDLKNAAGKFVETLNNNGFQVTVIKFATDVEKVESIDRIPDTFDDSSGDRWTSLYAAVMRGLTEVESGILVVFSDGADNYSQNHGVDSVDQIERMVLPWELAGTGDQRVIHAIGFGNVATEKDRNGLPALTALEKMSRNGSFSYADQSGALDNIFQDVAARIRDVYIFEYYSPNLQGSHELIVEARVGEKIAVSPVVYFQGTGNTPSPSGPLGSMSKQSIVDMEIVLKDGMQAYATANQMYSNILASPSEKRAELIGTLCDGETFQQVRKLNESLALMRGQVWELFPSDIQQQLEAVIQFENRLEFMCEKRGDYGLAGFTFEKSGLVQNVIKGSGAEAAGLKAGDKIIAVDGKPWSGFSSLFEATSAISGVAGERVEIRVLRGAKELTVKIVRKSILE